MVHVCFWLIQNLSSTCEEEDKGSVTVSMSVGDGTNHYIIMMSLYIIGHCAVRGNRVPVTYGDFQTIQSLLCQSA